MKKNKDKGLILAKIFQVKIQDSQFEEGTSD